MTSGSQTRLKLFVSSAFLLLFLSGCQISPQPVEKPAPPPPPTLDAAAVLPLETIRSICLVWGRSLARWQDSDAERTKDEIDFSIRQHEVVCMKYLGEG